MKVSEAAVKLNCSAKVASWISDNDHPSCIYAAGKAYHVRYR